MKLITAWDDGELKTLDIKHWATLRGESIKFYQQRLRNGYTEDEAINLPKKALPEVTSRKIKESARQYDTNFKTKRDKLWKLFATGALRRGQTI